jgi:hypothetical protein
MAGAFLRLSELRCAASIEVRFLGAISPAGVAAIQAWKRF